MTEINTSSQAVKLLYDAIMADKRTMEAIATEAGISRTQLQRWKNGQTAPTLPVLLAVSQALGVRIEMHMPQKAAPPVEQDQPRRRLTWRRPANHPHQ